MQRYKGVQELIEKGEMKQNDFRFSRVRKAERLGVDINDSKVLM